MALKAGFPKKEEISGCISKDGKVNWEIIKGIISDYYFLEKGYRRIHDYNWSKSELHKNCFGYSKTRVLERVKLFFNDLKQLNENPREYVKDALSKSINSGTFSLLCNQVKKVAFVLYDKNRISESSFDVLCNLSRCRHVTKISGYRESTGEIKTEQHKIEYSEFTSCLYSLNRFVDYLEEFYEPESIYIRIGRKTILKYLLSNLGMRISSVKSIRNSDIEQNTIRFKIFKKKNSDGFVYSKYTKSFINSLDDKDYFSWFFDMKENNEDLFFSDERNTMMGGITKRFSYWIKNQSDAEMISLGWEYYSNWKKNTHSGRHGFIHSCVLRKLGVDEISAITKQNKQVLDKHYISKSTGEIQSISAMSKFANSKNDIDYIMMRNGFDFDESKIMEHEKEMLKISS